MVVADNVPRPPGAVLVSVLDFPPAGILCPTKLKTARLSGDAVGETGTPDNAAGRDASLKTTLPPAVYLRLGVTLPALDHRPPLGTAAGEAGRPRLNSVGGRTTERFLPIVNVLLHLVFWYRNRQFCPFEWRVHDVRR